MEDNNQAEPQLQQVVTEQPQEATPKFDPKFENAVRQLLQQQSQLEQQKKQMSDPAAQQPAEEPKSRQPNQQQQMFQQMEQMQAELAQMRTQREQEAERSRWDQVSSEIADFVSSSEDFPALRAGTDLGLHQIARDAVEAHYRETGEVMPLEKAAGDVEAYLLGMVEKVAPALGYTKPQAPRTITNADSSTLTPGGVDMNEFVTNPFAFRKK